MGKDNCKVFLIVLVFFIALFLSERVMAQEISLDVNVDVDGSALVFGSADLNPEIYDLSYENKTISGFTQELTTKQGNKWVFVLGSQQNYTDYYVKITLPKGAKLLTYSGKPLISSVNGALVLEFSGSEILGINIEYTLEKVKDEISWENIVIFSILILLIVAILVLFLTRKKIKKEIKTPRKTVKKESKLGDLRKVLNERENQIIDLLIKEGRKSTQGRLQKISGIPKASFSRHLNNLAKKGIILKEGSGKLNLIRLKIR